VAAYLVADLLGGGCSQYLSPVLHEEKVALARKQTKLGTGKGGFKVFRHAN
jgi:hypothetical protein